MTDFFSVEAYPPRCIIILRRVHGKKITQVVCNALVCRRQPERSSYAHLT